MCDSLQLSNFNMVINIPSKLAWMNCCLMQSLYRFDAAYHTTVHSIVLQLNELITYHVKSTYSQDSLDSINVLQSVHKSHTHLRGEWRNSHLSNKIHSLIFSRIGCRWPQAKYRHIDRGRCNSWRNSKPKKKYSQHSRKVAMTIPSNTKNSAGKRFMHHFRCKQSFLALMISVTELRKKNLKKHAHFILHYSVVKKSCVICE